MHVVFILAGLLQIVGGILVFMSSKSAIHEILGAIAFGMGVLCLAMAAMLGQLNSIRVATERHADAMEVLRAKSA